MEANHEFKVHGEEFFAVPCLNDGDDAVCNSK
jgi:hypothetical protein